MRFLKEDPLVPHVCPPNSWRVLKVLLSQPRRRPTCEFFLLLLLFFSLSRGSRESASASGLSRPIELSRPLFSSVVTPRRSKQLSTSISQTKWTEIVVGWHSNRLSFIHRSGPHGYRPCTRMRSVVKSVEQMDQQPLGTLDLRRNISFGDGFWTDQEIRLYNWSEPRLWQWIFVPIHVFFLWR